MTDKAPVSGGDFLTYVEKNFTRVKAFTESSALLITAMERPKLRLIGGGIGITLYSPVNDVRCNQTDETQRGNE